MNKSDIVKSWKICNDFYVSKDDKVRVKTSDGLVEGIIKDVDDKGPKVFIGANTSMSITIGDIDWIQKIDGFSYESAAASLSV